MKNKLKLLTSIATLLVASSVIAEESGSINLSLTVGNGSSDNNITLSGTLHDNPTAPALSFDNGKIITDDSSNGIGTLKFIGSNIASGYQCSLKFESDYLSPNGSFELREAAYTSSNLDAIPYTIFLQGTVTTGHDTTVFIFPADPTNGQKIKAETNSENKCIIDITKFLIYHNGDPLPDKKHGNYSGTLTYTMTIDSPII